MAFSLKPVPYSCLITEVKHFWSPKERWWREGVNADATVVTTMHGSVAHLLLPLTVQIKCLYFSLISNSFVSVSSSLRKLRLEKHISRRLKQNQTVQSLQMRVYFRKGWSANKARWSDGSTAETDEEEPSVSSRSSYTSQTSNSNLLSNSPESLSLESYSSGCVESLHFKCEQMSPKASAQMEGVQSLDEDNLACLGYESAEAFSSACFKQLEEMYFGLNPVPFISFSVRLPNLGQTCYMNSVLQGLLTLTPFVQEVHNHQQVWQSQPECKIIRCSTLSLRTLPSMWTHKKVSNTDLCFCPPEV